MFKVLRPLADAYIHNRVIDGSIQSGSNVGAAGSLDLFKLYGTSQTRSGSTLLDNTELSRLLVKFDLAPLRTAVAAGQIDPTNSSFSCKLHLYDVYGGQPTPSNFTVAVYPLSASFDEGLGKDVVGYSDYDVCNFLSASRVGGAWYVSGCALAGGAQQTCDYITGSAFILNHANLVKSQVFVTGEEDLDIDVTTIVSATLAGLLPDVGMRISLDSTLETDQHTYFVKRFASRKAFNEDLRPKMFVRYDDSVQDDTNNLYLDARGSLFLYNYVQSSPANLASGSSLTSITGSNSLILQMKTGISGGTYSLYFTGSQHYAGINPAEGIYSASVLIPSTNTSLAESLRVSGSITFTPIWQSFDGLTTYLTGSDVKVYSPQRGAKSLPTKTLNVTVLGLQDSYESTSVAAPRINIFDYTSPMITVVRVPVELPGVVIRDVHYQVRDAVTNLVAIPFDVTTNSTRVSNDSTGMFFTLDMSNLTAGHSYVIDVLIVTGNNRQLFKSASQAFRVDVTT